ncbi:GGDEF domain-containing protein [Stenotrophomonas tuberculopleuritidis]|uniref:GGDEF domain-containing protein n=1 Tax=Stenotrophomonas tuberculopleuritidis TaxID=3055079 RepID=UPI0026E5819C|nr:GGDEF domain-containing protein [Stenotrophomonas sp. 704A1]
MGHRAPPNGLQTWLWILAGLFVLCTLPLMAIALVQGTQRYTEADDNLVALRQLRQTFELANRVSAERGPANSLLGADVADAQEHARLAAQLAVARQRVDVAATGLHAVFEADPRVVEETPLLRDAQRRLQAARGTVDRVAALPLAERSVDEVDRAISSMFAVYDRLQALTSVQISDLVGADREAAIPALQGQVLIDLREHGGRLASNVMAPLAVPGAWRAQQVRAARQTEGRLLELWRLAASHESVFRSDPALSWHWDMARRQFFGQSLPMIEQLIEDGRRGVPPRWTAAEFTARYVPTLQSLEALRDGYLGVSIARFEHTRNREAVRLAVLAGTALGTLMILGLAMRIAHVQILRPLLQAQAQVIQIASDTPGSAQRGTHPMAEMQRLFDAIEVLRAKSHQRAALTRELRELAGTDQLTGLLNRRSLDEQVQQRHAAGSTQAVVILLDVDHFKAINDGQGHAAGDDVLVQVAHLLQRQLRRNDSIARYGGEEFLVLLADADLAGARQLAETLRVALRQQDIALGDGQSLRVTASFGVAQGRLDPAGWRALVRAADAAMYEAKALGRDRVQVADSGRAAR